MYFSRNAALAVLVLALAACSSQKAAVTASPSVAAAAAATAEEGSSELGAPIYPGAHNISQDAKTIHAGSGTLALFVTPDSFAQVYDFYRTRLPKDSQTAKVANGASSVAAFAIQDTASREHTTVTISAKKGETDILIMRGLTSKTSTASPEATQ